MPRHHVHRWQALPNLYLSVSNASSHDGCSTERTSAFLPPERAPKRQRTRLNSPSPSTLDVQRAARIVLNVESWNGKHVDRKRRTHGANRILCVIDLQRLEHAPAMSLAALPRAGHRHERSRLEWLRCQWQLRLADAHPRPKPPPIVGPVVIIGRDKAIRESLPFCLT